jgi:hypothetical protein
MNMQTLKIGHTFRLNNRGPLLRVAAIDKEHQEIDIEWPDGDGRSVLIRRFPASCASLPGVSVTLT